MSLITKFKNLQLPKSVYFALIGIGICIVYLFTTQFRSAELIPPREPVKKPYKEVISGLGIIEAKDKNIEIAPFYGGIVKEVFVKEGDQVKAGTVLYRLDTDSLVAELNSQSANVNSSAVNLAKLKYGTRPEDIPPLEAIVKERQATYSDLSQYVFRLESVSDSRAVSKNDLTSKKFELAQAKADLEKAQADLNKAEAGNWQFDIKQAKFNYQAAFNRKNEIQTNINQAYIRTPIDSIVLKVNVNPGEYVSPSDMEASVIVGKNYKLQARVDIDEINASRVEPNMQAYAFIKGHSKLKFPLSFVRIEPYMTPKKNLSGSSSERTDTRVLQVIYEFSPPEFPVYIGQQVEVYLNNEEGKS
ncbi:MAG: HlyD family secretion protein [Candidatus Melainabacteria bacterium]|jgi:multidrug efflux pump subunit AcrA (membrane-fusion protein)